jgi:hypothetical protein
LVSRTLAAADERFEVIMPRWLLAALCCGIVSVCATNVRADGGSSSPPRDEARIESRIVNGRRVYVLPGERVRGERQAPYEFTLPGRGPLGYTLVQLTRSDTARVVEAVRHAPF